jgi:hypothetical protein
MKMRLALAALSLTFAAPSLSAQQMRAPLTAAVADAMRLPPTVALRSPLRVMQSDERRGMPSWVKWGLVGAAAGAITFPLLGSMATDGSPHSAGRDAVNGAVFGFVIVGGSVAAYQLICGEQSASRRAGLCGR